MIEGALGNNAPQSHEDPELRPCDVHIWAYGNSDPQPGCKWCPVCQAWICDECRPQWTIRGVAAMKRAASGWLKAKERRHRKEQS